MENKRTHNTSENKKITVLRAPNGISQVFSVAEKYLFLSPLSLTVLLLSLVFFVFVSDVFSKPALEVNFGTEQTLNLFPTHVETNDWAGVENVLMQDHVDTALYQDFGAQSSAYVPQNDLVIPSENSALPPVFPDENTSATSSSVDTSTDINIESVSDTNSVVDENDTTSNIPKVLPVAEPENIDLIETQSDEPISFGLDPRHDIAFKQVRGVFPLAQFSYVTSTEQTFIESIEIPSEQNSSSPQDEVVQDISEAGESPLSELHSSSTDNSAGINLSDTDGAVALEESLDTTGAVHDITLSGFDTAPLEPGHFINGMQLRMSFAAQLESPASGTVPYVEILFGSGESMESVGVIALDDEVSNALNGGYFLFALPTPNDVTELANMKVTVRYHGDRELLDGMFLDAAWFELDTRIVTKDDLHKRGVAGELKDFKLPSINTLISDQVNFRRDENPVFNLRYNSQRNFIIRGLRNLFGQNLVLVESVQIKHNAIGLLGINPKLTVTKDGLLSIEVPDEALKEMRPGQYEIELTLNEGGKKVVDSFNFQWGILTTNPNKSEYQVGEIAQVSIGALTPNGHTICEANLNLYVSDPQGFVLRYEVSPSGLCDGNNIIDVPDFTAEVPVTSPGVYELYLERLDDSGNVLGFTTDTFNSVAHQEISIERNGPTRIYPPATYPMSLTVSTTKSFTGTLTEVLPASFEVYDTEAKITSDGTTQTLTWDLSLLADNKKTVSYRFNAPDISPYLFNLGPARLDKETQKINKKFASASSTATSTQTVDKLENNNVFIEHRRWQIASDAVGKMLLFWANGASVPSGWTCVSCTSGDPFYQRFVMGSSTYNSTGGAATHTHTSTGSVLATASITTENTGSGAIAIGTHTHTYTPTINAVSNLPEYRQLRVIRYDTAAGEPSTIPAGAIGIFDVASSSLPTGWNRYTAQDGKYIYGENTPGTTGGSNTHTHTITGTTGAAAGGSYQSRGPDAANGSGPTHTHTVSSNTGSVSNQPPYIEVLLGQITSNGAPPNNLIAMWDADVDAGWLNVSALGSDPFSNRFLKASTTYGGTGGATTHSHTDVNSITSSGPSVTVNTARAGSGGASDVHTHAVNVTSFSTDNHLPPYLTVVFGKRQGVNPVYRQLSSRWYVNANTQTPTDPWPSGASDLSEKVSITSTTTPVKEGERVRLRMNVGVTNATSTAGSTFKLQYAAADICSSATGWTYVGDAASTTLWRGYNNTSVSDHATITSRLLASSTVSETYEENGYATGTPNNISVNNFGEWDFVLQHNGATAGINYCFRMVKGDGTVFTTYSHYPRLLTNDTPEPAKLEKLFDNEKMASTTPWFYFYATDAEGDKVHYEIEVDNDYNFSSPVIDRNTISNAAEFENQVLISDKAPFRQGEQIKFVPTTSLTNGTTYYWRVRAQDPEGSADWGSWSTIYSFTVNTSLTTSGWFQTQDEQFDTNAIINLQTTSNSVSLASGQTTGSMVSTPIVFTSGNRGTAWDNLTFSETDSSNVLKFQVEYFDTNNVWSLIPDADLSGNSAGFNTSPVNLLNLDVHIYGKLRLVANFTANTGTPSLQDWTVNWGYRVETPTITKLFSSEQIGTTTPTFEFTTTDPQNDSLTYQVQWSTTPTFTSSTTRTSGIHAGFVNIDTGIDTDPFISGDTIQFTIQAADALTNATTYWWRVRAKDTTGANAYSFWTTPRSFTVVSGTVVSTWFQTTKEQFSYNTLSGTIPLSNNVLSVATTATEAMIVYGEGTVNQPRYRQWNGTVLGGEGSLLDIGSPVRWAVVRAGTTREEYVAATIGTDADVNAQVFSTGEWGDLQEMTTNVGNISARGFDVAYETNSGDAMVAYCDGDADPSYYIWNGNTWTSGGTINLSSANNCEWIQLASDPVSDEIIILSRDSTGGQYEAQVWSGSAWGNSTVLGTISESAHEGMSVMYEESGGQAIIITSDGNPARFRYNTWSGTAWGTAATQTIGDDLEWGRLVRDIGSDEMILCYQDEDSDIGYVHWTGSAWTGQGELIANSTANAKNDPAFDCVFEDTSGRNNYVMGVLGTTTQTSYSSWNNTSWSTLSPLNAITDSATMQLIRTGNKNILGTFFNDSSDALRFSTWSGSSWSTTQTIEADASVGTTPFGHPYFMAARNPGISGTTVVSPPLNFSDGTGPYWKTFSWNDSRPGSSQILYHLQYLTATGSWAFIPNSDLPYNVAGTSTGPFDLSNLNTVTYATIRPYAELSCSSPTNCPSISDWKIEWAGGITVSGTIQGYNQSTNVTSGTVAVAVNGVLQVGKTGSISGGTWSINNVTAFPGDIVTVFVTSAADTNEAVAVTRYDGQGDMSGVVLYERHLTLGSNDATTTPFTNSDIGLYDFTNTEDVFFNVSGTTLNICGGGTCSDAELYIKSGSYFTPSGKVLTHDLENNGTFTAGSYTHEINGSWDNNATTTMTGSTVVFAATNTTEVIDNTGSVSGSFNNVTFGTTTGSATWTLGSTLDVNGVLTVARGTLSRGTTAITVAGNLITGANGYWVGIGTTTFDGTAAATWNDQNSPKQNIGRVEVDGTNKVVTLAGNVAAGSITIGANDTLDASTGNYDITVFGNWRNNNNFLARSGEVFFAATSSGKTITTTGDAFYDLTFNGVSGGWSFTEPTVLVNNDIKASAGTVTLPTGTTTVVGTFNATGGTFAHNNGTLLFTSGSAETITFAGGLFSNVANNLTFNGAGSWTITDSNATSTNDIRVIQGTVNFPTGVFAIGGTIIDAGGAFVGGTGKVLFYSSGNEVITAGGSSFGTVVVDGGGTWSFSDTAADVNGDLLVRQGTFTLPNGTFTLGGSYINSATVVPGTGTLTFDSTSSGKTVDFGDSTLYNVVFNSGTGGWTITGHATTTNNFTLTSVGNWTLASAQLLSVGNVFSNVANGASTTWTGSTLSLEAGSYSINSKNNSGDVYATLKVKSTAHAAMWNSSASVYQVASGGSLYSQDHAAVNGDLYIFGNYVKSNGSEYWSYATDFDGTTLLGSERQANVRLAAGATAEFTNTTLSILGGPTASTTIANQGSGTYTVSVTGGTTTAQYYQFTDLGPSGLSLLGGTVVPLLRDGSYTVGTAAGTALTLSSSTIDTNPGKQIYNVTFATSTAISAKNVTQTDGAPTSYWWFRDGHGNLYGEAYDNDTGDPGSVRFDDSSLLITVAGVVYSDGGLTPIVGGTCDGATPVVRVMVDGVLATTTSCSSVDGSYSASNIVVIGDPTVTVFLNDASGGEKGSVITRTPTSDILNMDIYANRVIVRNEDVDALTIANMAVYDNDNDNDLRFTAATSTGDDSLTVFAGNELHVFATSTFTPSGVVTLRANAAANGYDGTLYLDTGATFNAYSTSTLSIGGRLTLDVGAIFNAASTTVLMNATTTGKSITASSEITFHELVFNGVGGGWNLGADIHVNDDMTLTAGTVTGTGDIYLSNGSLSGNGVLSLGAGTTTLARTNSLGGSSAWTFFNLELGDTVQVGTTTPLFTSTTTISGRLTINAAHYLDAGNTNWDLAGAGTVFVENGTFFQDISTIRYSGAGANVLSTQYYNLDLNAGAGTPTYIATGLGLIVDNDLTIGGDAASTFDLNTNDQLLDVNGDVFIRSNGTLSASDTNTFTIAGSYDNNGIFTGNGGTVTFNGSGTTNIAAGNSNFSSIRVSSTGNVIVTEHATATTAWTLLNASTFTVSSGQSLAVGGTFFNAVGGAATTWTGSTLRLFGGANYNINAATTSDTYATISVDGTTQVRAWNSSASIYDIDSTASLYSRDHAGVDGDLYIWGAYRQTTANDHWSYATDFDGTALGSPRKVDVFLASGASVNITGGTLAVFGISSASTTIQNQGSGTYAITVGGNASSSFKHSEIQDISSSGLVLTGSAKINALSHSDFSVSQNGGTAITVGGTVITANPAKNFTTDRFRLDGVGSGFNVTATGTSVSSWRFVNHYGDIDGESFDIDPNGDPGYIAWADSAALITITGRVYADEGSTVSGVCDGTTGNIRLWVAGLSTATSSCNAGTGEFQFNNIAYGANDSLIVYIDGETEKGATVTIEPISNINNLDIYENRVIARHESVNPLTIADMAVYDSSDDADIPFTAVDTGTDTLTLPANRKLLVWSNKDFAPNGNVTISGGGAGSAYDGTLELQTGAAWSGQGTELLSVGGSFITGAGAAYVSSNGTTTFTTNGAARTIDINEGNFYHAAFTGSGSWTIVDTTFTVGGNFSQTNGTLTFPTGTSTFSGSFTGAGGDFTANDGLALFNGTGSRTLTLGGSNLATVRFTAGSYTFSEVNATATKSIIVSGGSVTLPSGTLGVGGNFRNVGGSIVHNTSELVFSSTSAATLLASSSDLYGVRFVGGGSYTFEDDDIALLDSLIIESGDVTLPTGTLAVGGSFDASAGTFAHASGTILFNSSDTGEFIDAGMSPFNTVLVGAPTGGYTIVGNATTTNNFALASSSAFTVQSGSVLTVGGVFLNSVGGNNTTWTGSTLKLIGANEYTVNNKTVAGDRYQTLIIGPNTDVRLWNSAATTTTVHQTGSLYSQDHAAVNGNLNIYGDFHISTTTEHWSYATDFDGTSLTGSERVVTVRHAANATTTVDGGTLRVIGTSGNVTTITNQGLGTYAMNVGDGTFFAQRYAFRNLNANGLNLYGTPAISSLSYGDFELAVTGGTLISLSSTTLNANASMIITGNRFATTTAISGKNVTLTGSTSNAWTFVAHTGNLDGEGFDVDGATACGSIRWSDSACLLTQQTNYRWRNDDGGLGVQASEWYDTDWNARKYIRVKNVDSTNYSNAAVKMLVSYDSDMQADFDDIRFTASDGTTVIPHWVGSSTNNSAAEIWVSVPSLVAEDTTDIFMYYNNPTATTTSSSSAVFSAADDFEDGNITEYSGQTTLFGISTTFNNDGTYGIDNAGDESSRANTGGIYRLDQTVSQGETFRYKQYVDTTAGTSDETCTLFGVQAAGDNYAICIEQFGVDRISLVRDAIDNDASGIILASSTVTYTTGWYEVEVEWGTDDSFVVSLYDASGSLVTTFSGTDNTYTSGGIGFTFWFHNGGWDSVTSRPTLTTEPTVLFGVEQSDGGATWKAAQNVPGIYNVSDVARLRLSIENSGTGITGQQFLLEYAPLGAAPSCEAVNPVNYQSVPIQASCGTSPVCMQSSTYVTNGASTVDLLREVEGSFIAGESRENPSNISGNIDIAQNQYTELEYVVTPTNNVVDESLCFRVTDNGLEYDTYLRVARLNLRFDPVLSAITLNDGLNITLLPGTTTMIYATGTVSDGNGYADLLSATTTFYRSGVTGGASCTPDNNDCYRTSVSAGTCSFTNCVGDSCTIECAAPFSFHADPTATGTAFDGEDWYAFTEVEDTSAGYDFTTSLSVDLEALRAIDVYGLIDYGTLTVNSDTGSYNASTSVFNQGNVPIDLQITGTDLSDGLSSVIPADKQKFATSTFTYGSCGVNCDLLSSTTPVTLDVDLGKPTADSPPVEDDVFWGIAVPIGINSAPHQGINVFTPVSP